MFVFFYGRTASTSFGICTGTYIGDANLWQQLELVESKSLAHRK